MHNIVSKKQHIEQKGIQFDGVLKAGYELAYNYSSEKPHQVANIVDNNYRTEGTDAKDVTKKDHKYEYDANGNLVYVNTERPKKDGTQTPKSTERKLLWDEENRLEAIDDNGFVSNYWYDAAGERTVKTSGESQQMYVNSVFSGGDTQTANFTAYVNPYLVVSKGGQYTKHIYIGSQRIVSKLGDLDSYGSDPRRIEYAGASVDGAKVDYATKYTALQQTIKDRYAIFEVPYYGKDNDDYVNGQGFCCDDTPKTKSFAANDNPELFQYYYHSDHLGSSSLITNLDGEVVQHIEYVPFGEVFIEERNNTWNTPYLFNAKELDEETGNYFFGKRYYDPRISLWLSPDLLQEKYPNVSTYAYCVQNPVKFVDPDGAEYYYAQDGTLLGRVGTNTDVKVVSEKNISTVKFWIKASNYPPKNVDEGYSQRAINRANSFSLDLGMTNDELNLRATLSTLKQTEAGSANPPLDYNAWNNGLVFTEKSYSEVPSDYASHPGMSSEKSSAAGAYQFLKRFYGGEDFSPMTQDREAVKMMTTKGRNAAKIGNVEDIKKYLSGRWTSLDHWSVEKLKEEFKKNISKELNSKSTLVIPIGEFSKKE